MLGLIWIQTVLQPDGRIQRVKFGTRIKCEGIIKAILEHPKAYQITLFSQLCN